MKVLVTGASGLIGSRFVSLEKKLELFTPSHEDFDISNPQQLAEVLEQENPEWVLHFADYTNMEKAEDEEKDLALKINHVGTKNLSGACARFGIKIMYLSTDHVFPGGGIYEASSNPKAVNKYGISKLYGEQAIMAAGRDWLIVRTSYPYRAKFEKKNDLIRTLLAKFQEGKEVELVEDQFITPTFIDELVEGISKLVKDNKTGIYHISGLECLSLVEIGTALCEVFRLDFRLLRNTTLEKFSTKYNKKAPQPKRSCINSDKFQKEMLMVMSDFKTGLLKMKTQMEPIKSVKLGK